MEWFADLGLLRDFESWLGRAPQPSAASAIDAAASVRIVAEEVVLRGMDWLEKRWSEGADKVVHMALARRARNLSPAEFSERWRSRPGRIGGAGSSPIVQIPAEARGLAYVQNHTLLDSADEPHYDAINEVYFDDLASMRARVAFFQSHDVRGMDADLFSEATFIAVHVHVIE